MEGGGHARKGGGKLAKSVLIVFGDGPCLLHGLRLVCGDKCSRTDEGSISPDEWD